MGRSSRAWISLVVALALSSGCDGVLRQGPQETEGEWPQWRGPGGLGISPESELPETWNADSANIRWHTEIPGVGNSSPIVSRGKVFLTAAVEQPQDLFERVVHCLDADTGELLWTTPVFSAARPQTHVFNTIAAPTPVSDGKHVFAYFGSVLASLDHRGRIVWKETIEPNYDRRSHYGASSSPVLVGDKIIVVQDKETGKAKDPGWIAAFDKITGRQVWRHEWQKSCCTYSTPLVLEENGGTRLLLAHSGRLVEYDPGSGEPLWHHKYIMWQMVPTAVAEGDMVCASGGGNHHRGSVCMRLRGAAKDTEVEELWTSDRAAPQTASPVLYRGMLFTIAENAIMSCYDAESGKVHWRKRLARGNYRSSLVAGDGKVYVVGSNGITVVVAAEPEFRQISENLLDRGSNASPAIAHGHLLVRTTEKLFSIGKEQRQEKEEVPPAGSQGAQTAPQA